MALPPSRCAQKQRPGSPRAQRAALVPPWPTLACLPLMLQACECLRQINATFTWNLTVPGFKKPQLLRHHPVVSAGCSARATPLRHPLGWAGGRKLNALWTHNHDQAPPGPERLGSAWEASGRTQSLGRARGRAGRGGLWCGDSRCTCCACGRSSACGTASCASTGRACPRRSR